jgi:hypothetical protein
VAASEWASAGEQLQKVSHLGSGLIWTPFVQSGKRSCRYSGEVVAGGRCEADTGLGESATKEVHDRATGSAANGRAHGGGGGEGLYRDARARNRGWRGIGENTADTWGSVTAHEGERCVGPLIGGPSVGM